MHDAIAITSVLEADAGRSQISRPQEGRQGPGGREEDGPFWSAEWKWRREYRVSLSAAFETVEAVGAAEAVAPAGAALRIDS